MANISINYKTSLICCNLNKFFSLFALNYLFTLNARKQKFSVTTQRSLSPTERKFLHFGEREGEKNGKINIPVTSNTTGIFHPLPPRTPRQGKHFTLFIFSFTNVSLFASA
jgi:hypothetical protein